MNVNMRVSEDPIEGIFCLAKALFNASLGQRAPGLVKKIQLALKARFTSDAISFIIRAMPQSLSKVILHIIFSTKMNQPA